MHAGALPCAGVRHRRRNDSTFGELVQLRTQRLRRQSRCRSRGGRQRREAVGQPGTARRTLQAAILLSPQAGLSHNPRRGQGGVTWRWRK